MKKVKAFLGWCMRKARGFWPWYKGLYKGRAWYTKTLIGFVSFIALILIYLGAVDINFLWLFGKSPAISQASWILLPTKPRKSTVRTGCSLENISMRTAPR